MANKIAAPCDSRCQYALNVDCDCICGGKAHGSKVGNMEDPGWVAKFERLSITRKAFRKELNEAIKHSGTHLYRHEREEFDKQYLIWRNKKIDEQTKVDIDKSNDNFKKKIKESVKAK